MLNHLSIKGLAIIEELSIDFTSGFCVITGETGAGKSILIKALNLLFGAKSSAGSVRKGCDQAIVCGQFYLSNTHSAVTELRSLGISVEEDEEGTSIIIRRSLSVKGRSQAWINDVPVTMSSLRGVTSTLVDVFGQHENTRLLDASTHTTYLDQFLPDQKLLNDISITHKESITSLNVLRKIIETYRSRQRSSDYLSYRVEELEKFNPSKEDYFEIQKTCKESSNILEIKDNLDLVQATLDDCVDGESASKPLWDVHHLLIKAVKSNEEFSEFSEIASDLASKIDDLSFEIGKQINGFSFDENELEEKQERLSSYQDFFRKLLVQGIDELLVEKKKLAEEIDFLNNASYDAESELKNLSVCTKKLASLCKKLTAARIKVCKKVKSRVESEFSDLAMPGASFDIRLEPVIHIVPDLDISIFGDKLEAEWADICDLLSEQGERGMEKANFMLSSNPGEPSMPLQKIASGGEVSRIMLALKKALLAGANTCILVFDEIDTGISGRVASMVGKKMKELSKDFQIICISHLPQVAAFADSHYLVHKFGRKSRTESTITKLDKKESIDEIAKLLSGDKVSKTSLANAKSLIQKAVEL